VTLSPLNRKLLRDILLMRGQALAIAMVVAAGVAMYVMYLSNFESLRRTQRAYYQQHRFADVFASVKRAPGHVASDIARMPGVAAVETRVVALVMLDLPQLPEPAAGRLISLPAGRRPGVNDLFLRRGRWIEPNRPDEVLASEGFVLAHGLQPGDGVRAIINGRLRRLTIAGVALSPEYVYSIRPGEIVPDDKRFGVFWMGEEALAAAFDMEGGFNDVALLLDRGASADDVIARLDRVLEPYGGLGAIPRERQVSHWILESELRQLQSVGFVLPLVFLMVAAFILNVALTRALVLQRPQIAALKALGYTNAALAWHYVKWALLIAAAGIIAGFVAGAWLGRTVGDLYNEFFRFPVLLFSVPVRVTAGATLLTMGAASIGAFTAVRHAVRVPPAEAMRPEPPMTYHRSTLETPWLAGRLGTAGRMVLRNISRRPFRTTVSIAGIALAVAILMVGLAFVGGMNRLIETQFWVTERQDVTVVFVEPRSSGATHALARLPGVMTVEPQRAVAARIRAGHRARYLAVTGIDPAARLRRIVDSRGRDVRVPPAGIVLSATLADALGVEPGDEVTLDALEGRRPSIRVHVTGVVDDVLGLSVYMDAAALRTMMQEGPMSSGALLLIDPAQAGALSTALRRIPGIAGSSFKRTALQNFRDLMAANLNLTLFLNVIFAGVIAFGVVYNAARISLSERSHELASLRVLGYTRAEISLILLGELALLTLAALPAGAAMGYGLAAALVQSLQSEVYRFPLHVPRQAVAWAWLSVIGAALLSGLIVRRQLDRLDLVGVLKVGA
jgi:putative ABC transport system permease protein